MAYHDDIRAERKLHEAGDLPGKLTIMPTHYAYRRGQQDFHEGRTEPRYLAGGEADRHWRAGYNAARADKIEADRHPRPGCA